MKLHSLKHISNHFHHCTSHPFLYNLGSVFSTHSQSISPFIMRKNYAAQYAKNYWYSNKCTAEVQTRTSMGTCSLLFLALCVPTLLIPVISPGASFQPHTTRSYCLQPQWKRIFPSISATHEHQASFSFHSLPTLNTNHSAAFKTPGLDSIAHRPSLELLCCVPLVVPAAS